MTISVKEAIRNCKKQVEALQDRSDPANSTTYQQAVADAATALLQLWRHCEKDGVFSKNESINEWSTTALELFTVPYLLGQATERQLFVPSSPEKEKQVAEKPTSSPEAMESFMMQRKRALTISNQFYKKFLDLCAEVELINERELEKALSANDRTTRVQRHSQKKELTAQIQESKKALEFARKRGQRVKRILNDDDAENLDAANSTEAKPTLSAATEDGSEDVCEDEHRTILLLEIRLSILETYDTLQMANKELEMFGAMTAQERIDAVQLYQAKLLEPPNKTASNVTYIASSRYPGAPGVPDPVDLSGFSSPHGGALLQEPSGGANYRILNCGHTAGMIPDPTVRNRVRVEAFQNRNLPTQTLEEFAEGEMAFMAEQQRLTEEMQRQRALEDERIGADGVEERERKEQAAKDDWRDDHPKFGITNKGNYS